MQGAGACKGASQGIAAPVVTVLFGYGKYIIYIYMYTYLWRWSARHEGGMWSSSGRGASWDDTRERNRVKRQFGEVVDESR